MRRGRRKALHRRERDFLRKQRYSVRPRDVRETLAFRKDTCLEKERVRSKVTPRKVGVGLKQKREPSERRLGWRLSWWGSTEKKEASHLLKLRGRHQYSDQRSNRNGAPCEDFTAAKAEGEEDQITRSSA